MEQDKSILMRCLFSVSRKRQLMILRQLENYGPLSGEQLADSCHSSRRTVISAIEELRNTFEGAMTIDGTSSGYELIIEELIAYRMKKRKLLMNDPNLLFIHFLCQQESEIPKRLEENTGLGIQTINKQAKQIQEILKDYDLKLDKNTWKIEGSEVKIRYFYENFYFGEEEQPYTFYENLQAELSISYAHFLPINPTLTLQWVKIFLLRMQQGGKLEENPEMSSFCQIFVEKTQLSFTLFGKPLLFSNQELCVLLLLIMDEEGVLSFLINHSWVEEMLPFDIYQIIPGNYPGYSEKLKEDSVLVKMTIAVALLDRLFHVPLNLLGKDPLELSKEDEELLSQGHLSRVGYEYLFYLQRSYFTEQMKLKNQIIILYQLQGPEKIQQWIRQELSSYLKHRGIQVVSEQEKELTVFTSHQIVVTDYHFFSTRRQLPLYHLEYPLREDSIEKLADKIYLDFHENLW